MPSAERKLNIFASVSVLEDLLMIPSDPMERNLIIGQLLALLTAACWAQNSLIYRHLGSKIGTGAVAHVRMWIAFPAIALLSYVTEGTIFPTHLSLQTYLVLFTSGFLGYFLTDLLLFHAYVWLGARESMVIMTISPVASALFSYFLFAERLSLLQVLGILLTIAGVIVMMGGERREAMKNSAEKQRAKGMLCAILASILQALSFLLAKFALDSTGPVTTNLLRNVGGLLAFVVYNGFIKRNAKQQFASFTKPSWVLLLFLAAMMGPVLGMSSQMKAFTLAPLGIVTTITQSSPLILLPIDRYIFKRKISSASLIGTCVSVLGIGMLFLSA